jgi:nucleoid DNA-binding protein
MAETETTVRTRENDDVAECVDDVRDDDRPESTQGTRVDGYSIMSEATNGTPYHLSRLGASGATMTQQGSDTPCAPSESINMIRIPFLSRAADGQALQRCLNLAAGRSGVDVGAAAFVMSLLFEAIADELTKGRVVRVPGFGVFAPAAVPERHRRLSRFQSPRCKPVFSASRGFRAQVAMGVGPLPENAKLLSRHKKNHSTMTRTPGRRVFSAMRAFREQIAMQLGRRTP